MSAGRLGIFEISKDKHEFALKVLHHFAMPSIASHLPFLSFVLPNTCASTRAHIFYFFYSVQAPISVAFKSGDCP